MTLDRYEALEAVEARRGELAAAVEGLDRAIREASSAGASLREIAQRAGMTAEKVRYTVDPSIRARR